VQGSRCSLPCTKCVFSFLLNQASVDERPRSIGLTWGEYGGTYSGLHPILQTSPETLRHGACLRCRTQAQCWRVNRAACDQAVYLRTSRSSSEMTGKIEHLQPWMKTSRCRARSPNHPILGRATSLLRAGSSTKPHSRSRDGNARGVLHLLVMQVQLASFVYIPSALAIVGSYLC
jgi:hypothetical protein